LPYSVLAALGSRRSRRSNDQRFFSKRHVRALNTVRCDAPR
jgi:hypothetical protein